MSPTSFGHKLKALREARGISLRSLSEELGKMGHTISHAGIQQYEREAGSALPRRAMLAALCKFFNVEPSWFIEEHLPGSDASPARDARARRPRSAER